MHVSSRRMAWRVASTVVGMLLLLPPPSEHDNTLVISEVRAKKMACDVISVRSSHEKKQ